MARFEFRLERLLALRDDKRHQCRTALAAAIARQAQIAERRQAAQALLAAQRTNAQAALATGRIALEQLRASAQYEARLRDDVAALARRHDAAHEEVERCQQTLAAAEGELRALEELRQRSFERFALQQARRETQAADEVACRQHALQGQDVAGHAATPRWCC